jgi:hypothetical protein
MTAGSLSVLATGLTLLGLSYFNVHSAALSQLTTLVLAGALFLAAGALIFRQTLIALYGAHVGRRILSRRAGNLTSRLRCPERGQHLDSGVALAT